jgi:SAM-dependent methyltransferase
VVARELPGVLEDHFAGEVAVRYDDMVGAKGSPEVLGPTVDLLARLAGDGAALELAVGTGRVALPLAARGVPVSGIELSPDMVAQLRAKPGGDAIPVAIGDMATTRIEGAFRLVYLLDNTIGNVETQDRQVACFANATAHLEPGGSFVIENVVPELRRLVPGHDAVVFAHEPGYVGYDRYDDLVGQHAVSHHFVADGSGAREVRTPWRYVWPSELDLMARLAGMTLAERWGGWRREPFTRDSAKHVSVWRKQ